MSERILLFIGTYTRAGGYPPSANGKGIYAYTLDPATGALTELGLTPTMDNPSYLTIHPAGTHLYCVSEVGDWPENMVCAYAMNPETGQLTYLNMQPSFGSATCFVALDHSNRYLLAASYIGRHAGAVYPLQADGSLAPASSRLDHEPRATPPAVPHGHCAIPDPTNRYVVVVDLGIDQVLLYPHNLEKGQLAEQPIFSLELPFGAGPRHLTFHPNGQFAYLINELNGTMCALLYDAEKPSFSILQTLPTLPDDFHGENNASAVHLTPDGRFLYGANRGHDSIAIYSVDQQTGLLTFVAHQPTLGNTPRDFDIDPTGTFLLAANMASDTVIVFRIDPNTGLLTSTGHVARVPTPVCVKMLATG